MSSSVVEICNRALSEIGTQSTITSLAEESPEAVQCSLWYDNTRTGLLRAAPWAFARKQGPLTQLGDLYPDNTSPYPWLWKYAYPSDCLKFRYLIPPLCPVEGAITPPAVGVGPVGPLWGMPSRQWRFIINSDLDGDDNQIKTILANLPQAIGCYTADITDPNMFDSLFDSALGNALAYHLVIPLTGNAGMREQFRASAKDSVLNAMVANANEAINKADIKVDWIQARGAGSPYGYALEAGYGQQWGQWYSGNDNWSM